jgi:hypothetical protein
VPYNPFPKDIGKNQIRLYGGTFEVRDDTALDSALQRHHMLLNTSIEHELGEHYDI